MDYIAFPWKIPGHIWFDDVGYVTPREAGQILLDLAKEEIYD